MQSLHSKNAQKAALIAALCAAMLAIIKAGLYITTGSLIVALSAWDSALDTAVSLINRKIVKFARRDADDNHPYGHGRLESIASFGQGSLILGGGLFILFSSGKQIIYSLYGLEHPTISVGSWGIVVFFLFGTLVSLFVTKWLQTQGKKLNSPALLADSEHYRVDAVTNIASAVGLSLVLLLHKPLLDPCIAGLFSIYILYGAVQLLKTSIDELMDHDISQDVRKSVLELIFSSHPSIVDVHRLRGRKVGHRYYFDCHVTLPHTLTFHEVHEIIEKIEEVLNNSYEGDCVIHADPDNIR